MSREERASRAVRLRDLMADGDIKAVFETVTEQLIEEWKSADDANERDNLWRSVKAVERLEQALASLTSEARLSSDSLSKLKQA